MRIPFLRPKPAANLQATEDDHKISFAAITNLGDVLGTRVVSTTNALEIPSVWRSVDLLSNLLSSVPIKVMDRNLNPVNPSRNVAARCLENIGEVKRRFWFSFFSRNQGVIEIVGNEQNKRLLNTFDQASIKVEADSAGNRRYYQVSRNATGAQRQLDETRLIVLPYAYKTDGVGHLGPFDYHRETIERIFAVQFYSNYIFKNGGIPGLVIKGPALKSGKLNEAVKDIAAMIKLALQNNTPIPLPDQWEITPIGFDPEKLSLVNLQRFMVEESSRFLGVPSFFLGETAKVSYQSAQMMFEALHRLVLYNHARRFEEELERKLLRDNPQNLIIRHDFGELLRPNYQLMATTLAQEIHSGQLTINEARALRYRPAVEGGDIVRINQGSAPVDEVDEPSEPPEPPEEQETEEN